jgi:hypothetical protein
VQVAVYDWKSAVSGNWSTAKDWTPTGGPTLVATTNYPYNQLVSEDSAVFDTGSNRAYTVSGIAHAKSLTVSSDKVTFNNFTFSNDDGTGFAPTVTVENNADVTISAASTVSLFDGYGGSPFNDSGVLRVSNAELTIHGAVNSQIDIAANGTVTVSGSEAQLAVYVGDDINAHYGSVEKGGVLNVKDGGSVTGQLSSVDGTVNLSDGALSGAIIKTDGTLNVSHGATINNLPGNDEGTYGFFSNDGAINVASGIFALTGGVAGSGTITIDKNAALDLGGSSSNNVVFMNQANLQIASGATETGFLQSFGKGDTIDVGGVVASSLAVSNSGCNTILSLYDGSSIADQLTFAGNFSSSNFYAETDSSKAGTLIAFETHHIMSPIPIT